MQTMAPALQELQIDGPCRTYTAESTTSALYVEPYATQRMSP